MNSKISLNLRYYFLPFLGGLFYAWGFPLEFGHSLFIGPILGLIFLGQSLRLNPEHDQRTFSQELISTLFFALGANLLGYYWIPYTIKEFGGIFFPFNYLIGILFSLIVTPHFFLFLLIKFPFVNFVNQENTLFRNSTFCNFFYALILTLLEIYTPQQFPAHMGHTWLALAPNLGLAPIFGVAIFSFANYWICFSALSFFRSRKIDIFGPIFFGIILTLCISFPLSYPRVASTSAEGEYTKTNIRLVQANIGNNMKIGSEQGQNLALREVLDIYYHLSIEDKSFSPDLIIWPETAFPTILSAKMMSTNPAYTPFLLKNIVRETGAEIFFGGYDHANTEEKFGFESDYNTAFLLNKDLLISNFYHKMKLIPFGEGLPFGPLNEFFANYIQNISYFARGSDYTLFKLKNSTPFSTAICYEILFSEFIRTYLNHLEQRPHFIVNLTNDSWYGETSEPLQHLFLAHWRALEFQLPIVRMTNTGITSVLYPDGSEGKRLGINKQDKLDVTLLTKDTPATLYQKYGVILLFALWAGLAILILLFAERFQLTIPDKRVV